MVFGQGGSGKTTLILNVLTRECYYKRSFTSLTLFCPSFGRDPQYNCLLAHKGFRGYDYYSEDLLSQIVKEISVIPGHHLIWFDDLDGSVIVNWNQVSGITQLFNGLGRHGIAPISLIGSFQNVVGCQKKVRNQGTFITIFTLGCKEDCSELIKVLGIRNSKEILDKVEKLLKEAHSFVSFDRQDGRRNIYWKLTNFIQTY